MSDSSGKPQHGAREPLERELRAFREYLETLAPGSGDAPVPTAKLAEADERFRFVLEHLRAMFIEIDAHNRVAYVSPTVTDLLGYTPEEITGRPGIDWIHPEDVEEVALLPRYLRETGRPTTVTYRARHKDGHWIWIETVAALSRRGEDGAVRNVTFSRDVTAEKQADDALRESEDRHRIVADISFDIISEVDEEGRNVYSSPTMERILGYTSEELRGRWVFDLVHPDDRERSISRFRDGFASGRAVKTLPHRVRHKDGHWVWLEGTSVVWERADGRPRFLTISRDISERLRAEEERRRGEDERLQLERRMQQAQKLEGLGVMAGGIAHDFNNLLTPILGEASLALLDLPPESPARLRLQKIQRAAHRAAALTSQMLAYAGADSLQFETLDLTTLVADLTELIEGSVSGRAAVHYDLAEDLPPIEGDAGQLSQVVMNLVTNAFEAVGEGEGRIDVRTAVSEPDPGSLHQTVLDLELADAPHVCFEVVDDGCGMDADTRARIFDPFFTTKFTGRGLGLATVLGIVRGHRGAIQIDSEPGRGTRFRMLFPIARRRAAPGPAVRPEIEGWEASGTLLVIDDDGGVRELVEESLARVGLTVLKASDGAEGVALFGAYREQIRGVILDRTMPATAGAETFESLRRIRPDVPILLMSGYAEASATGALADRGLAGFLRKPFQPRDLLARVRDMLEKGAAGA